MISSRSVRLPTVPRLFMWDCCFLPTRLTIHSSIWFISPDRLCFIFSNTVGRAGHRLSPLGGDVKKQRWALTVRASTLDLSHSLSHSNPHPLPNHYHHYHQTCHGPVILEQHSGICQMTTVTWGYILKIHILRLLPGNCGVGPRNLYFY